MVVVVVLVLVVVVKHNHTMVRYQSCSIPHARQWTIDEHSSDITQHNATTKTYGRSCFATARSKCPVVVVDSTPARLGAAASDDAAAADDGGGSGNVVSASSAFALSASVARSARERQITALR